MRRLIDFLPSSNTSPVPELPTFDSADRIDMSLDTLIPANPNQPYDMKELILQDRRRGRFLRDPGPARPQHRHRLARINGRTVGIVANQPMVLAGVLDSDAGRKGARFVRFCDCFNIPIVTLVDVPGFLPGTAQEYGGLIKHGAKLLFAYAEATVPKITVITRKAYGGAYVVMASKHLRGDVNYAWPTAEIAVMGSRGRGRNPLSLGTRRRAENPDPRQGLRGTLRQSLRRRRARLPRRSDHAAWHQEAHRPRPQHAAQQGADQSLEEARQHSAVSAWRQPPAVVLDWWHGTP